MARKRKNNKQTSSRGSSCHSSEEEVGKRGTRQRSSRERNTKRGNSNYSYNSDDYALRNSLEADGLEIVDMTADGNCLFRAISDQLYGDYGSAHDETRSQICDFIEMHKEDFQFFLVLDDEDCEDEEDAKDFEGYIQTMREDGEWGGNVELVAAARLYERNITVYSALLAAYTIECGDGKVTEPDLLVSFHDNDHYNSVRNSKAPPKPRAKRRWKKDLANLDSSSIDSRQVPKRSFHNKESSDSTASTTVSSSLSELSVEDARMGQGEGKSAETKPVKKNAPCPCGSGRRFKKCCLAKEKHAARLQKLKADTASVTGESGDESVTMKGNFRVLQI